MPMLPQPPQPAWPEAGLHQGRQVCAGLLRQALLGLAPGAGDGALPLAGTRVLWLADTDFADWPLDEPPVLAALTAWLRQGGRQLRIGGDDFEATARLHPRLVRWRRDWTHVTEVWAPTEGRLPPALRGLLAAPLWLQWQDTPDWRMRCITDAVHARATQAQIADFLQRCEPAWPVTALGL
ncbi:MAG: hypothetical protein QE285_06100 [Aquabacterium sp.]|nr:hypothetical protein [Aquabacterium sp.]